MQQVEEPDMKKKENRSRASGERGSISVNERGSMMVMVLSGIALSVALGMAVMQVLSGPIRGSVGVAASVNAQSHIAVVGKIMAIDAASQASGEDCDDDSFIEPRPFVAGTPAPVGGGHIPAASGAPTKDPWGTDYGYCVWDVGPLGPADDVAGCGGTTAARLDGANNPLSGSGYTQTVMAVISAGPDGVFQTSCSAYADDTTDVIATAAGSDDIVRRYSYMDASSESGEVWALKNSDASTASIDKDVEVTGGVSAGAITTTGKVYADGGVLVGDESSVPDGLCDASSVGLVRYSTTGGGGGGGGGGGSGSPVVTYVGKTYVNSKSDDSSIATPAVDTTGYDYAVIMFSTSGGGDGFDFGTGADSKGNSTFVTISSVEHDTSETQANIGVLKLDNTGPNHTFIVRFENSYGRQDVSLSAWLIDTHGQTLHAVDERHANGTSTTVSGTDFSPTVRKHGLAFMSFVSVDQGVWGPTITPNAAYTTTCLSSNNSAPCFGSLALHATSDTPGTVFPRSPIASLSGGTDWVTAGVVVDMEDGSGGGGSGSGIQVCDGADWLDVATGGAGGGGSDDALLPDKSDMPTCTAGRVGQLRYNDDPNGVGSLPSVVQSTPIAMESGMATPAVVQTITTQALNNSTASPGNVSSAAFGTDVTAGNSIIIVAACWKSSANCTLTASDSAGNSYSSTSTLSGAGRQRVYVFRATNVSAGATTVSLTVGATATYVRWGAYEVSGLDQTAGSILDRAGVGTCSTCNANQSISASAGDTYTNVFAVAGIVRRTNDSNINFGAEAGWTQSFVEQNGTTGLGFSGAYRILTGSVNPLSHTWTNDAFVSGTGYMQGGGHVVAAFKARMLGSDSSSQSFSSTPTPGNAIVVTATCRNASSICEIPDGGVTDNQGNTYNLVADGAAGGNVRSYIFLANNIASSGTFTITVNPTGSESFITWGASEVTGMLSTSPTWTYCGSENGTCSFTGTKVVKYGTELQFYTQTATGSIGCNNSEFGDPIDGSFKHCWYADTHPPVDAVGRDFGNQSTAATSGATQKDYDIAFAVHGGGGTDSNVNYAAASGWTALQTNNNSTAAPAFSTVVRDVTTNGVVSHTWQHDTMSLGRSAAIATFRGLPPPGVEVCDGANWNKAEGLAVRRIDDLSDGAAHLTRGNVALGLGAHGNNDPYMGYLNTAVGISALANAGTWTMINTAIGYEALYENDNSTSNTAVGYRALRGGNPTDSTAIGYEANMSGHGSKNTSVGYQALRNLGDVEAVTGIGHQALMNSNRNYGTAFGYQALKDSVTGEAVTAFGYRALTASTASGNSAMGHSALVANTSGANNTAMGYRAGAGITTGSNNSAIGNNTLENGGTASGNTVVGDSVLRGAQLSKVQVLTRVETANVGVSTATFDSDVSSGNAIIVAVACRRQSAACNMEGVTDNKGNTYHRVMTDLHTGGTNRRSLSMFVAYNVTGGQVTLTVDPTYQSRPSWVAYEMAGIAPGGLDSASYGTNSATTTTSTVASGGALSQNNTFTVAIMTLNRDNATNTYTEAASPWVLDYENQSGSAGASLSVVSQITTTGAGSTLSHAWTHSSVNAGLAIYAMATFKADFASGYPGPGNNNTAVGHNALMKSTAGGATALGAFALQNNTSGVDNTAVGYRALRANTTGVANTAVGAYALESNNAGGAIAVRQRTEYMITNDIPDSRPMPALPLAGSTIFAAIFASHGAGGGFGAGTVTDTEGNTYVPIATGGDLDPGAGAESRIYLFAAYNIASPIGSEFRVTYTPTLGNYHHVIAMEVTGIMPTGALDQLVNVTTAGANSTSTTATTAAPTSQADEFAIAIHAMAANDPDAHYGTGAGWTQQALFNAAADAGGFSVVTRALSSAGVVSHTWTHDNDWGNSTSYILATFRGYPTSGEGTGSYNTAFGAFALRYTTTGSHNTAAGYQALHNNTTGSYNTAMGNDALNGGISIVQMTPKRSVTNVGSDTASFLARPEYGNTIVVTLSGIRSGSAFDLPQGSVTDNHGNTYYRVASRSDATTRGASYIYAAYDVAYNLDTAVDFNITVDPAGANGNNLEWGAFEVSGLETDGVVDAIGSAIVSDPGASVTSLTVTAGTPTRQAAEFAVSVLAADAGDVDTNLNITKQADWTQQEVFQDARNHLGYMAVYKNLSAIETPSHQFGFEEWAPRKYRAVLATFPAATTPVVEQVSPVQVDHGVWTSGASFSTLPDAGNTIIVTVATKESCGGDGHVAVFDNQGNIYRKVSTTTDSENVRASIFVAANIGAPTGTFTFSVDEMFGTGCTTMVWSAMEVSGLSVLSPVDRTGTAQASSGGNCTGIGVTASGATTQDHTIAFAVNQLRVGSGDSDMDYRRDESWIDHYLNNNAYATVGFSVLSRIYNRITTPAVTWTHDYMPAGCSGSEGESAVMAVFRGKVRTVNGTGGENTAAGMEALRMNNSGTGNTALGYQALANNITGSYNTAIGAYAGPEYGYTDLNNTTAIGFMAKVWESNSIRVGNIHTATISGNVGFTATSDRRVKKDIEQCDLGLDFINRLRPVSYRLKDGNGRLDYGFIAQEVQEALGKRETNMVTRQRDPDGTYQLRSDDLIAPLVKALQEQKRQLDELDAELETLKASD